MADSQVRLLWISDSPALATGYGRVTREILARLSRRKGFGVACLGWHHPPDNPAGAFPYPIHAPGSHPFGADRLDQVCAVECPSVIVASGDPWMVDWLPDAPATEERPLVGYLPVDVEPLPRHWRQLVERMDGVVCPSAFGLSALVDCVRQACSAVIPYGVDSQVFRPSPRREALRQLTGLDGRFVVGFVGRNHQRKQMPVLAQAFAEHAARHPDAALYLHCLAADGGTDVQALLDRYGVDEQTYMTQGVHACGGVSDRQLRDIYNLFDVLVCPSMSEGFGLPVLEAMACGVPVIATDCGPLRELMGDRGELIRVKHWLTVGPHNVDMALADVDHLVELLEKLYRDPDLRAEYGRRGRQFAETMTWDRCAEQWAALLEEVVADGPAARCSAARVSLAQTVGFWPLVSVLLIVRDGPVELLDRCLQSIDEHLTIPSQVIVSRESEDEALGERVNAWRRPRVVVVAGGSKAAGGNGAFELALRAVQARRLVLLDSRDALPPDWSQQTVDAVRDDEAGWEEFVAEATGALEDTPTKRCSLASTEADEGVAC